MVRMGVGRGGHQRKGRSTQPLAATWWDWGRGKREGAEGRELPADPMEWGRF